MPETPALVTLSVNGQHVIVPRGTLVAAAITGAGISAFRHSVNGKGRGPLCGMGICFECRVTIDGRPHRLACQTVCRDGMRVETG